jgi:D-alanyl-D-alanine carboxypeptidase
MKKIILKITFALVLAVSISGCNKDNDEPIVDACAVRAGVNPSHPRAAAYQTILDEYVQKGFPGLILYVKTPQGIWTGTAGKANIETGELMRPCSLIYSASMAKTFTAVSVMKLVEEGKISLDTPIKNYLPAADYGRIANFDQATVRQLLNHTSGIRNYSEEPKWGSDILANRGLGLTTNKNLEYVYDKDALFAPGTNWAYSNTGYILLARIIDAVTGASHANFFTNRIFRPLGLAGMYYKNELRNATPNGIYNGYGDLAGNGQLTNVTDIDTNWLASQYGEAGILGLASDYAKFVEAIFKGNLVSAASRAAMTNWEPKNLSFGSGLLRRKDPHGYSIGHLGDLPGSASDMFYFPDSDITIVMATNKGLLTAEDTKLYRLDLWNEVVRVALNK